jgi:hypothetical protein
VSGKAASRAVLDQQRKRGANSSAKNRPHIHPSASRTLPLGNQRIQQLLRSRAIAPKLRVSQPEEPSEREADRVADKIMRTARPAGSEAKDGGSMRKQARSSRSASAVTSQDISDLVPSGGEPLAGSVRAEFETRLGQDLGAVRVHTGGEAAGSAEAVRALAYTVGNHVVFGAGRYSPHTTDGRRLLAHELSHVVQGAEPRVINRQVAPAPPPAPAAAPARPAGDKDITIVAWSGSEDAVTWVAGAGRVGELDANSIDALVDAVHKEMKDHPGHIREMTIVGHGAPGYMSPGASRYLLTPAAVARLQELKIYFGSDGSVTLKGCQVARGAAGEQLLQQLADIWGVPVRAYTDIQHALNIWGAGILVERKPGERIPSSLVIAKQIEREIAETSFRTALRVINDLEEANRGGYLTGVISNLTADGKWGDVKELLTSIHVRFYPDLVKRVNALGLPGVTVKESLISAPSGLPVIQH